MNNAKKLRRRIQYIIVIPIVLALVLLGVTIYENGLSSKMGIAGVVLLAVYLAVVVLLYFRLLPAINSIMVDYSLEQGKIQKELLHELEIPYAILDTSGHIMWANNMFHETIGVPVEKRIRKTVDAYFPDLLPEIIDDADDMDFSLGYNDRRYKVVIKRLDLRGSS